MNRISCVSGIISALLFLNACSEAPKDNNGLRNGIYFENSNDGLKVEEEGPQYQTPTIEQLKGKPQLFPAKYPVKRYPGSKVAMVDVRPNRPAGWKNQVMLSTADPLPNISDFYRQKLATENWQKVYEYRNELYESTRWINGDLECEVRICPDLTSHTDKKFVQLFYGKRRKSSFEHQ